MNKPGWAWRSALFVLCLLLVFPAQAQDTAVVRDYDLRELEALAAGLTLDPATQSEMARRSRLALAPYAEGERFLRGERVPGQAKAFILELFQARLPGAIGYELTERGLSFVAPAKVHAEARSILRDLRRCLRPSAALELRSVVAPAGFEDWADAAPGAPVTTAAALGLEAAIARGQAALETALRAPFRDGEVRLLAEVEATGYLARYELNQTGLWPVLNAAQGTLLIGEAAQVHLCRRPGGTTRLDVRLERAERLGMRSLAFPKAGTLQLPRIALERLGVSAELVSGRWTLLARRSREGRLRLLIARVAPSGVAKAKAKIRRYPLRSLLDPVFDFPLSKPWERRPGGIILDFDDEEESESEHLGSLSQARARYPGFFAALERALSLTTREERARRLAVFRGALFVSGPEAIQRRAAGVIARWSRRSAPARIELIAARVSPSAAPRFGPLSAEATRRVLSSASVERIALAGFVQQQVQYDRLDQRAFVGAIERSSGGQGQVKVVSQPVVEVLSEGLALKLRALGEGGVELALELSPAARLRRVNTAWGPLELVEQGERARLDGVYPSPDKGATVIGLEPVDKGAGEEEKESLRLSLLRSWAGPPQTKGDR